MLMVIVHLLLYHANIVTLGANLRYWCKDNFLPEIRHDLYNYSILYEWKK